MRHFSSESESESSADSSPPVTKEKTGKKSGPKHSSHSASTSKSDSKDQGNSESDNEKPKVVRKLTRSSNTRKSKHLTGKIEHQKNRMEISFIEINGISGKTSDPSESENDSKRSLSKSPVKRAKNSKVGGKINSNLPKQATPVVEERKCLVDGCDSKDHLNGHFDKHFTQEACPLFHNSTSTETKAWHTDHVQREEDRRKATILFDPMKKSPTVEQKTYQLKIKEMRSNFKPKSPSPTRHAMHICHNVPHQPLSEIKREPNLNAYVPEYDLQLFREAQAIASEQLESDLLKLSPERGTK